MDTTKGRLPGCGVGQKGTTGPGWLAEQQQQAPVSQEKPTLYVLSLTHSFEASDHFVLC